MHARIRVDGTSMWDATGECLRLGRDPDCEVAMDPLAFPTVSGVHARIEATSAGFVLVHLSRNNRTLLNDVPVEGSAAVQPGDRVRLGFTGPTIEILAMTSTSPA